MAIQRLKSLPTFTFFVISFRRNPYQLALMTSFFKYLLFYFYNLIMSMFGFHFHRFSSFFIFNNNLDKIILHVNSFFLTTQSPKKYYFKFIFLKSLIKMEPKQGLHWRCSYERLFWRMICLFLLSYFQKISSLI